MMYSFFEYSILFHVEYNTLLMLNVNSKLLVQNDIRFDRGKSYLEILKLDELEIDSNETLMIVSLNNSFYQLNLLGAVVIDSIKNFDFSFEELANELSDLFVIDRKIIEIDIKKFLDFCIDRKIIINNSEK